MIFPLQPLTVFLVILYLIHSAPVTLELNLFLASHQGRSYLLIFALALPSAVKAIR